MEYADSTENSLIYQQQQHPTYLNLFPQNFAKTPTSVTPTGNAEKNIELDALIIKGVQNWTVNHLFEYFIYIFRFKKWLVGPI